MIAAPNTDSVVFKKLGSETEFIGESYSVGSGLLWPDPNQNFLDGRIRILLFVTVGSVFS